MDICPDLTVIQQEIAELLLDGSEMGSDEIVTFFREAFDYSPQAVMTSVLFLLSEGVLERAEHRKVRLTEKGLDSLLG